jgi:hypothetical protein
LRGTGKDVLAIFADEFLFFNPAVLPALLPTLATGAIFVMTSSVSPDGDNQLVKLLDTKYNDGTDVVRKLNWVQSCKACERKGQQDRCTHIQSISFIYSLSLSLHICKIKINNERTTSTFPELRWTGESESSDES